MSETTGMYVARPRLLWDDTDGEHNGYERRIATVTVHETDGTRETGLLDTNGNPLVFRPHRVPMGFRK